MIRIGANRAGRDFVVGDIHGEFELLETELARVGFDGAGDRLFCVGDLIDRGPDSPGAIDWLDRSWFFAVRGNHEDMALRAGDEPAIHDTWMWNGGLWWLYQDGAKRAQVLAALATLPYVIEVDTAAGPVGIVHADIPPNLTWQRFLAAIETGDLAAREYALWSRKRRGEAGKSADVVPGIRRIYCGHTPVEQPTVIGNVHYIDTGAYLTGRIAVLPIAATD